MGDLNTPHDDVRRWLGDGSPLRLAPRPPGLAAGYRQSDHVAVDGLEVRSVAAHWTRLSDHPVVVAELDRV